jgi:hypothetical protein
MNLLCMEVAAAPERHLDGCFDAHAACQVKTIQSFPSISNDIYITWLDQQGTF